MDVPIDGFLYEFVVRTYSNSWAILTLTFEGAEYNFHGAATPLYFSPTSLFCINDKNPIRRAVVWLITWKWFDRVVTIVIIINSVLLAIRDYTDRLEGPDYVSEWNNRLDEIGKILSIIFMVECILKIVGMGFIFHKTSYL